MFDWLVGAASSALGGGLIGAIGSCFSSWMQLKAKKLEYDHEKDMAQIDIEMQQAELSSLEKRTTIEWEGKTEVAEVDALTASYKADRATYAKSDSKLAKYLFPLVDFFRGITRPGLTVYLCILVTIMFFKLQEVMGGIEGLDPARVTEIFSQVVNLVLFLAATSVTWWFGSRAKMPKVGK